MSDVVLLEVSERIATVTINRPEARNALNNAVRSLLPKLLREADGRDDVDVVILTGADPAFCAGLDLKELGAGENRIGENRDGEGLSGGSGTGRGPFAGRTKPLIGAVNGIAITGGFELALNCDFLVASERAKFGDTHTRVGVMPGWGMTVLLPQAIGVRRAREMSLTGNFMLAEEALQFGLVNHVVAHDELIPFTRKLAADIIGNDQQGVRQILATYNEINAEEPAWQIETRDSVAWSKSNFSPDKVAERRAAIQQRGRTM